MKTNKSFFGIGILLFCSIISCNNNAVECYYIPSERVLVINNWGYRFTYIAVNLYKTNEKSKDFERVDINFKTESNINSVDFDNIDLSKLDDVDTSEINKIKKAKCIDFTFINIKESGNNTILPIIKHYSCSGKSSPMVRCETSKY